MIVEHTSADRVQMLMNDIWEGGPVMDLPLAGGPIANACVLIAALFPAEWEARERLEPGEPESDRVTFADGSKLVVHRDGDGVEV